MTGTVVRQVAHVCIFARDLDETARFYKDALGLDKVFNFTRQGRVFGYYLGAGGRTHVEVFENAEARYSRKDQISHFCLEVESIDDAVAHIRGLGIEITDKKKGCDDTWQAWVEDPNGVRIELFEYTGRSAQFTGGDREADW